MTGSAWAVLFAAALGTCVSAQTPVPTTASQGQGTAISRATFDRVGEMKKKMSDWLLATEAGMRSGSFGKYAMSAPLETGKSNIVGLNGAFELESFVVYRNLDDLLHIVRTEVVPRDREIRSSTATGAPVPSQTSPVPAEDRAVVENFFRQWHVVTISHCARWQLDCADTLLASAQQYFGETADVLTLSAAIAEARGHTSDARAWLQKALTVDSSHASARLRLGRMLAAAGRSADAERELTQALDGARAEENRGAMYFALTALADLDTRANRTARARQRRAEAAALGAFDHEYFAGLQPAAIYRAGLFYEQVWRVAALRRLSR